MEVPNSSLVLYASPTSPFARKVRVLIEELSMQDEVEVRMVDPHQSPDELVAINPMSRVPTLVLKSGEALPDSSLICVYLLSRASGKLPMTMGSQRWSTLRRQQLADGIIETAVTVVMESRRPESIVYTTFVDRQTAKIRRLLAALEAEADKLSRINAGMAEISLGVALAYLDFRLPYLDWRHEAPALAEWFTEFEKRPSMLQTAIPSE